MVNMDIFKDLLECAYDLDILHFEKNSPVISIGILLKERDTSCYILTNDGDLEINITEIIDYASGDKVVSFHSTFKSNLNSFGIPLVKELIETQLETEAFLGHDDYENILCVCEFI